MEKAAFHGTLGNGNGLKGRGHFKKMTASVFGLLCVGLVVLVAAFLWPSARAQIFDKVVLRPLSYPQGTYDTMQIAGIEGEDVFFPGANGSLLHGWFFRLPGCKYTALVSH